TIPLSRHIFRAPTRFYKTGIVLLAYLNGHQDHFTMAGGQESARSTLHLAEIFRLADAAGLLRDPALAVDRMRSVLSTRGVEILLHQRERDARAARQLAGEQQRALDEIVIRNDPIDHP